MRWVAFAVLLVLASPAMAQEARGPIQIYDDEDWLAPTSGVRSGSGTAEDPYIVSGWRIERPLVDVPPSGAAIHIENTAVHVIFRDITVEQRFNYGVRALDAENLRFEDIHLSGQQTGAAFHNVVGLRVQGLEVSQTSGSNSLGGVVVQGAPGAILRAVQVRDGVGPGLVLSGSDGSLLEAVLVSGHDSGLRINSMHGLVMLGVEANGNRGDGMVLANLTKFDARGLRAVAQVALNGQGGGRGLVAWSVTGSIQGVQSIGNQGAGAHIWDGRLEVRDARFLDNGGVGLLLAETESRLFAAESHGNGGHGIAVYAPASNFGHLRLIGLQTHDNEGAGLFVQGLRGVHIEGVRADRNDQSGIDVRGSENLTVLRTHMQQNLQAGLLTVQVRGGQVVDAWAQQNAGSGFALRSTHALTLRNNTALQNGQSGYVVEGTDMALLDSRAIENQDFGIEILGSALELELQGNTLIGNGYGNTQEERERRLPAPWLTALALLFIARRASGREDR